MLTENYGHLHYAGSGRKRNRHGRKRNRHEDDLPDEDAHAEPAATEPAVLQDDVVDNKATAGSIFNNQFKSPNSGYNAATLSSKSTETFIYDWYSRGLGIVKGKEAELRQACWMSSVGSKVSTDNQADAKSLMKLIEMVSTESQMESLKGPKPDAAKDSAYVNWEISIKGMCKALTIIVNDFLTLKEGKVGNAKALTVGAMARRWKMLKFPVPVESELKELHDAIASSKPRSSSSSSSKSSSSIKAKSTILKASGKVKVTV